MGYRDSGPRVEGSEVEVELRVGEGAEGAEEFCEGWGSKTTEGLES